MVAPDRRAAVPALALSIAIHAVLAAALVSTPPMFRSARRSAPIEVALVRAVPLPPLEPPGGGGGPALSAPRPERTRAEVPPPRRRPRPAARERARPPAAPAPSLPQAAAVEPGPELASAAMPTLPGPEDAPAGAIGAPGDGAPGSGSGSGGGSGGGRGGGEGPGRGNGGAIDVPPRLVRQPGPAELRAAYPDAARREGLEADVKLQLLVSARGEVSDVRVVKGAGNGFDDAAVSLVRRFVFRPAEREGRPVPVWISWTYRFRLEG